MAPASPKERKLKFFLAGSVGFCNGSLAAPGAVSQSELG